MCLEPNVRRSHMQSRGKTRAVVSPWRQFTLTCDQILPFALRRGLMPCDPDERHLIGEDPEVLKFFSARAKPNSLPVDELMPDRALNCTDHESKL
jgi:hypothetical protein